MEIRIYKIGDTLKTLKVRVDEKFFGIIYLGDIGEFERWSGLEKAIHILRQRSGESFHRGHNEEI